MLTAEKLFCQALSEFFPDIKCTVAYPDELWVRDSAPDAICLYIDEIVIVSAPSDKNSFIQEKRGDRVITRRQIGNCQMTLILSLRTRLESRLNELTAQLLTGFPPGKTIDKFQIYGQIISNRVPPRPGINERICERVFRIPLVGPFEETGEAWPVKEVKVNV